MMIQAAFLSRNILEYILNSILGKKRAFSVSVYKFFLNVAKAMYQKN